ncbi:MAG: DUF4835 family protein [Bacteroidetes bacterium]|nr:DUF4835 family protein [Bacteroidota bacterium]
MIKKAFFWVLFLGTGILKSQDFNCRVQVVDPNNDASYKQLFGALQVSVLEFYNNRKWSADNLHPNEKIEINITINIDQKLSIDQFQATFAVQAVRPVFNTNYTTPLLNYFDKEFTFRYAELQSMDFDENQYNSFTSFLGFYANMVLGLEYDSFGENAGSSYFGKAQNIVNIAQSASESGWKQVMGSRSRNRYNLISDFTNSRFKLLHDNSYKYHRQGLDIMSKDAAAGRSVITEVITSFHALAKQNPNTFAIKIFFDAKVNEIIEIYKKSDNSEKMKIVEMLKQIDITNAMKYDTILNK